MVDDILSKVTEIDILYHYFGCIKFGTPINSPLREDRHPSFVLYINKGRVRFKDFSTGEGGGLFDFLMAYWGESYKSTLERIWEDLPNISNAEANNSITKTHYISRINKSSRSTMECRIRSWKDYDLEYWESYGITLPWLKWADVYPISHKIIIKDGKRMVFKADKYAYAYIERKEGNITLKIYQPFNRDGFKWCNKHDKSVVSLWTRIPEYGDRVCICSSLKDALCLSCNTGIPALAVQGEGYGMSDTAINELKRRFKKQYILFDNDKPGIEDGIKLSQRTGFTNIILPPFNGGKDVSDLRKVAGKNKFLEIVPPLFNTNNNDLERN